MCGRPLNRFIEYDVVLPSRAVEGICSVHTATFGLGFRYGSGYRSEGYGDHTEAKDYGFGVGFWVHG